MASEPYSWRVGSGLPKIQPHSQAKHDVLRAYLEKYVEVLTANPRRDTLRLTLVDGFAGGGLYLDARTGEPRLGSPLLMLEAMRTAEHRAQQLRRKDFKLDCRYFFIEKSGSTFEHLKKSIADSDFRDLIDKQVVLLRGTFQEYASEIIRDIQARGAARRALFVLDQYGYSDVPMPLVQSILYQLPNAEMILTFAVDWLIDYLSANEPSQKILDKLGVSLSAAAIAEAKKQQPKQWRRAIQTLLHHEIQVRSGAKFYTPFFITSPEAHRAYWLVHLSGHYRARDVMAALHWQKQNQFAHYGRAGLNMLGYDPLQDVELTKQGTFAAFHFDATAREFTEERLMTEIPERIAALGTEISFEQFFASTTNETPATSEIFERVLRALGCEGEIQIMDRDGRIRQRGSVVRKSDILKLSKQSRLFR